MSTTQSSGACFLFPSSSLSTVAIFSFGEESRLNIVLFLGLDHLTLIVSHLYLPFHLTHLTLPEYVLRGAASSAIVMFTCFMLYVLTITGGFESIHIPRDRLKHLWPALAFLVPLFSFFCPYDSITQFYYGNVKRAYQQRTGLVSEIFAVLLSPFSHVTFLRSFIADIFCSMPRVFTDFQYTLCIYTTGSFWDVKNEWVNTSSMHAYGTCGAGSPFYVWIIDLLSFLPYHIRLMQSLRVPSIQLSPLGLSPLLISPSLPSPPRSDAVDVDRHWRIEAYL